MDDLNLFNVESSTIWIDSMYSAFDLDARS